MSAARLPCLPALLVLLVAATPSSAELDALTAELVTCAETPVTGRRLLMVRCSPVHDTHSSSTFVAHAPRLAASALASIRCEKRARRAGGVIIGCRQPHGWFRFVVDAQGGVVETSSSSSTYTSSVSTGGADADQPLLPAGGDVFGDSALLSSPDAAKMARWDGGYYKEPYPQRGTSTNTGNTGNYDHAPATGGGTFRR